MRLLRENQRDSKDAVAETAPRVSLEKEQLPDIDRKQQRAEARHDKEIQVKEHNRQDDRIWMAINSGELFSHTSPLTASLRTTRVTSTDDARRRSEQDIQDRDAFSLSSKKRKKEGIAGIFNNLVTQLLQLGYDDVAQKIAQNVQKASNLKLEGSSAQEIAMRVARDLFNALPRQDVLTRLGVAPSGNPKNDEETAIIKLAAMLQPDVERELEREDDDAANSDSYVLFVDPERKDEVPSTKTGDDPGSSATKEHPTRKFIDEQAKKLEESLAELPGIGADKAKKIALEFRLVCEATPGVVSSEKLARQLADTIVKEVGAAEILTLYSVTKKDLGSRDPSSVAVEKCTATLNETLKDSEEAALRRAKLNPGDAAFFSDIDVALLKSTVIIKIFCRVGLPAKDTAPEPLPVAPAPREAFTFKDPPLKKDDLHVKSLDLAISLEWRGIPAPIATRIAGRIQQLERVEASKVTPTSLARALAEDVSTLMPPEEFIRRMGLEPDSKKVKEQLEEAKLLFAARVLPALEKAHASSLKYNDTTLRTRLWYDNDVREAVRVAIGRDPKQVRPYDFDGYTPYRRNEFDVATRRYAESLERSNGFSRDAATNLAFRTKQIVSEVDLTKVSPAELTGGLTDQVSRSMSRPEFIQRMGITPTPGKEDEQFEQAKAVYSARIHPEVKAAHERAIAKAKADAVAAKKNPDEIKDVRLLAEDLQGLRKVLQDSAGKVTRPFQFPGQADYPGEGDRVESAYYVIEFDIKAKLKEKGVSYYTSDEVTLRFCQICRRIRVDDVQPADLASSLADRIAASSDPDEFIRRMGIAPVPGKREEQMAEAKAEFVRRILPILEANQKAVLARAKATEPSSYFYGQDERKKLEAGLVAAIGTDPKYIAPLPPLNVGNETYALVKDLKKAAEAKDAAKFRKVVEDAKVRMGEPRWNQFLAEYETLNGRPFIAEIATVILLHPEVDLSIPADLFTMEQCTRYADWAARNEFTVEKMLEVQGEREEAQILAKINRRAEVVTALCKVCGLPQPQADADPSQAAADAVKKRELKGKTEPQRKAELDAEYAALVEKRKTANPDDAKKIDLQLRYIDSSRKILGAKELKDVEDALLMRILAIQEMLEARVGDPAQLEKELTEVEAIGKSLSDVKRLSIQIEEESNSQRNRFEAFFGKPTAKEECSFASHRCRGEFIRVNKTVLIRTGYLDAAGKPTAYFAEMKRQNDLMVDEKLKAFAGSSDIRHRNEISALEWCGTNARVEFLVRVGRIQNAIDLLQTFSKQYSGTFSQSAADATTQSLRKIQELRAYASAVESDWQSMFRIVADAVTGLNGMKLEEKSTANHRRTLQIETLLVGRMLYMERYSETQQRSTAMHKDTLDLFLRSKYGDTFGAMDASDRITKNVKEIEKLNLALRGDLVYLNRNVCPDGTNNPNNFYNVGRCKPALDALNNNNRRAPEAWFLHYNTIPLPNSPVQPKTLLAPATVAKVKGATCPNEVVVQLNRVMAADPDVIRLLSEALVRDKQGSVVAVADNAKLADALCKLGNGQNRVLDLWVRDGPFDPRWRASVADAIKTGDKAALERLIGQDPHAATLVTKLLVATHPMSAFENATASMTVDERAKVRAFYREVMGVDVCESALQNIQDGYLGFLMNGHPITARVLLQCFADSPAFSGSEIQVLLPGLPADEAARRAFILRVCEQDQLAAAKMKSELDKAQTELADKGGEIAGRRLAQNVYREIGDFRRVRDTEVFGPVHLVIPNTSPLVTRFDGLNSQYPGFAQRVGYTKILTGLLQNEVAIAEAEFGDPNGKVERTYLAMQELISRSQCREAVDVLRQANLSRGEFAFLLAKLTKEFPLQFANTTKPIDFYMPGFNLVAYPIAGPADPLRFQWYDETRIKGFIDAKDQAGFIRYVSKLPPEQAQKIFDTQVLPKEWSDALEYLAAFQKKDDQTVRLIALRAELNGGLSSARSLVVSLLSGGSDPTKSASELMALRTAYDAKYGNGAFAADLSKRFPADKFPREQGLVTAIGTGDRLAIARELIDYSCNVTTLIPHIGGEGKSVNLGKVEYELLNLAARYAKGEELLRVIRELDSRIPPLPGEPPTNRPRLYLLLRYRAADYIIADGQWAFVMEIVRNGERPITACRDMLWAEVTITIAILEQRGLREDAMRLRNVWMMQSNDLATRSNNYRKQLGETHLDPTWELGGGKTATTNLAIDYKYASGIAGDHAKLIEQKGVRVADRQMNVSRFEAIIAFRQIARGTEKDRADAKDMVASIQADTIRLKTTIQNLPQEPEKWKDAMRRLERSHAEYAAYEDRRWWVTFARDFVITLACSFIPVVGVWIGFLIVSGLHIYETMKTHGVGFWEAIYINRYDLLLGLALTSLWFLRGIMRPKFKLTAHQLKPNAQGVLQPGKALAQKTVVGRDAKIEAAAQKMMDAYKGKDILIWIRPVTRRSFDFVPPTGGVHPVNVPGFTPYIMRPGGGGRDPHDPLGQGRFYDKKKAGDLGMFLVVDKDGNVKAITAAEAAVLLGLGNDPNALRDYLEGKGIPNADPAAKDPKTNPGPVPAPGTTPAPAGDDGKKPKPGDTEGKGGEGNGGGSPPPAAASGGLYPAAGDSPFDAPPGFGPSYQRDGFNPSFDIVERVARALLGWLWNPGGAYVPTQKIKVVVDETSSSSGSGGDDKPHQRDRPGPSGGPVISSTNDQGGNSYTAAMQRLLREQMAALQQAREELNKLASVAPSVLGVEPRSLMQLSSGNGTGIADALKRQSANVAGMAMAGTDPLAQLLAPNIQGIKNSFTHVASNFQSNALGVSNSSSLSTAVANPRSHANSQLVGLSTPIASPRVQGTSIQSISLGIRSSLANGHAQPSGTRIAFANQATSQSTSVSAAQRAFASPAAATTNDIKQRVASPAAVVSVSSSLSRATVEQPKTVPSMAKYFGTSSRIKEELVATTVALKSAAKTGKIEASQGVSSKSAITGAGIREGSREGTAKAAEVYNGSAAEKLHITKELAEERKETAQELRQREITAILEQGLLNNLHQADLLKSKIEEQLREETEENALGEEELSGERSSDRRRSRKRVQQQRIERERIRMLIIQQLLTQGLPAEMQDRLLKMLVELGISEVEYRNLVSQLGQQEAQAIVEEVLAEPIAMETSEARSVGNGEPVGPAPVKEKSTTTRAEIYKKLKKRRNLSAQKIQETEETTEE